MSGAELLVQEARRTQASLALQPTTAEQQQSLDLLLSVSPFIGRVLTQQPELVTQLLDKTALSQDWQYQNPLLALTDLSEHHVFRAIRRYRNQVLAQVMAAELLGVKTIRRCLTEISALADGLINSAYQWAYADLTPQWGTPLDHQGVPMPLLILGMGKLGGGELNFSSDIDLIFTYPDNGDTQGGRRSIEHQQFFTKLGQKLISALHQVTADGFAYRVDMRLRPFGDSGPLVLSFGSMEDYYQAQGREWERYAMLKARVLNPDPVWTPQLQQLLKPFVYRRYIDFSALESLRRMKQLIEQENRRRNRTDNIKLGSGGIREVEFVVQTLQLIRGGRLPDLQQVSVFAAMEALCRHQLWSEADTAQLTADYLWLRRVEQVLQGIDDAQTQTLPQDELNRARLVLALGLSDWSQFSALTEACMARIHQQFKAVIDQGDNPEPEELALGRLCWDSQLPAQELAEQLDWLQPEQGLELLAELQQFKLDCQKRSVGPRGRDLLEKLLPFLLQLLAKQQGSATVLKRLLGVFRQIVSRTAYLELLHENPAALQQLVLLCAKSGWLAEHLARYPMLLDELIDPALLYQVPQMTDYQDRLRQQMLRVPADDLELQMEVLRQFKQAQQLRIAAADITGILPLMKVSDHLTFLAEALIAQVVELAWAQMAEKYGVPQGLSGPDDKAFAVIGYGKLGGLELGYGSDLDLVFVHQSNPDGATDGDKSIDSRQFYIKLVQRIVHIFSTRTASGVLYEVDTRLRPAGNSGLLAVHINTYRDYLQSEAWTWEHQALVRARLVYGGERIRQSFAQIRAEILGQSREPQQLLSEVVEMRQKLRQHHGMNSTEVKHATGGIVDLEFISQFLVLAHAACYPALYQYSDNIRILDAAQSCGLLSETQVADLQQAYRQLRGVSHRQTLAPAAEEPAEVQQAMAAVQQVWQQLFGAGSELKL
ncbi:bifunctional [glutamate--ammonia ligase]-adenylyl-L-tyrosine phosphorylase/[glutamate--ammonia-ligase] adenylyltransferase [Rheinheimera sp.]|uniref:bifunctional [glutamate--ammonia ligase]-adenylyl-L-tyrosine phosphorylase/[glutamate--ammonia-ligase] adenylyltransferase n=1 Tax=Rheinheimera sp. TaxID=1869214 RepID=UPI00307FCD2B